MEKYEADRKRKILEVAKQLFSHFGSTKVTMEDIAHEAGMTKPTLYYYFKNKDELFNEIVWETAHQLMAEIEGKIIGIESPEQKLLIFSETVYGNLKQLIKKHSDIPVQYIDNVPFGSPLMEKIQELFKSKLRQILQEGIELGIFEIPDLEITLETLMNMGNFIHMQWLLINDERKCDRISDELNRIILNGLIKRKNSKIKEI